MGGSATRDVLAVKPLIPFVQGLLGQSQVRPGLFLICPVPAIHRHLSCGFDGSLPVLRGGASGAPTTAQAEALQSEEVNTKLFVGAPCRVRADHLIGIVLVGLIAVQWRVAGLCKEVAQAIVFAVHKVPRVRGARGDLVQWWRVRIQRRGSSHEAT